MKAEVIKESIRNEKSSQKTARKEGGLEFKSRFVSETEDPYKMVRWSARTSQIRDEKGNVIFEMKDVEVPEGWSQLATDIVVSKYFRRAGIPGSGHEKSVKQLVFRVMNTIRNFGEKQLKYFSSPQSAENFEKDLTHLLLTQKAAFNSPVWFNYGLYHVYGVKSESENFNWDLKSKKIIPTKNTFLQPQGSACFIQSVDDTLLSIFELVKKESKIFRYGSGTGTNFSNIRSCYESISGGGKSSGVMSFLKVLDRGAGATKSGGTNRRAAKMVCLDVDHPEIKEFVQWKAKEEEKAKALMEAGYSGGIAGEAYETVSGQNSNNSVRLSDRFMKAVENKEEWQTIERYNEKVVETFPAEELWNLVSEAAWKCADPGVQFDDAIQEWHTCKSSGRINASNPCSEFMFLDNSACNLASLNLLKFVDENGNFLIEEFKHAVRLLVVAQDIIVDQSSYPTEEIAQNSHDFRPLGLGYANLGSLLMTLGLPYDSDEARAYAAAITALMHGVAYEASAELAKDKGTFARYKENEDSMNDVILKHSEKLNKIMETESNRFILNNTKQVWSKLVQNKSGYRNAQMTVLAPTGTIGLLMDCDTTGVEPDFALVKLKKLADGGFFKIVNQSVEKALKKMGYSHIHIEDILVYALGTQSLRGRQSVNREALLKKGLNLGEVERIEGALLSTYDIRDGIAFYLLDPKTKDRLQLDPSSEECLLEQLKFSSTEIEESNQEICGHMTVEGAPHLKQEHLPVFDCANRCGAEGTRYIEPMGHVRMMAAVQNFLSGAISKTVNLPNEASVQDIQDIYMSSWKLGLKAVAVYRDGSKMSQPLNTKTKKKETLVETPKHELKKYVKRKLPYKRQGMTVEATVGGHKIYVRTGEYEDGGVGEIFLDMHKEGASFRSLLNCLAISISQGLQYGVPLEEYVKKFTFTRFEPQGIVNHPNIKQCTSIVDYVFRLLGMEYLGLTDFVHVKPDSDIGPPLEDIPSSTSSIEASNKNNALDNHLSHMMGDAPVCNECGHTTVRNGTCYRCLNCGNSMGCS